MRGGGPGRVPGSGWVVFSQAGPGDGEERVGEHADRDVPVPGGPFADLILVQPELIFTALVVVLDVPPQARRRDHRRDRSAGRSVDQEVFDRIRRAAELHQLGSKGGARTTACAPYRPGPHIVIRVAHPRPSDLSSLIPG